MPENRTQNWLQNSEAQMPLRTTIVFKLIRIETAGFHVCVGPRLEASSVIKTEDNRRTQSNAADIPGSDKESCQRVQSD